MILTFEDFQNNLKAVVDQIQTEADKAKAKATSRRNYDTGVSDGLKQALKAFESRFTYLDISEETPTTDDDDLDGDGWDDDN